VRAYGAFSVQSGLPLAVSLTTYVDAHFGSDHPLAEAVRYVTTIAQLRPEGRESVLTPVADQPIELASCVRALGGTRDGAVLLERLQRDDVAFDLPREHRLLIGTRDAASYGCFVVDAETTALARRLERPITVEQLCPGPDPEGSQARLRTLCLLGAVALAGNVPELRPLRRSEAEADRNHEALDVGRSVRV
jgi:hypothetical protein